MMSVCVCDDDLLMMISVNDLCMMDDDVMVRCMMGGE